MIERLTTEVRLRLFEPFRLRVASYREDATLRHGLRAPVEVLDIERRAVEAAVLPLVRNVLAGDSHEGLGACSLVRLRTARGYWSDETTGVSPMQQSSIRRIGPVIGPIKRLRKAERRRSGVVCVSALSGGAGDSRLASPLLVRDQEV